MMKYSSPIRASGCHLLPVERVLYRPDCNVSMANSYETDNLKEFLFLRCLFSSEVVLKKRVQLVL